VQAAPEMVASGVHGPGLPHSVFWDRGLNLGSGLRSRAVSSDVSSVELLAAEASVVPAEFFSHLLGESRQSFDRRRRARCPRGSRARRGPTTEGGTGARARADSC
jgi:hypothetical protein